MKKFTFTLQALLHLKESLEKQERNTLGLIARRLNDLSAEKDELLRRRDVAGEAWKERLAEGMAASETQQYTLFFRSSQEMQEELELRIEKTQQELDACRARLVEVLKEIRMLEKLREKQYTQYLQEMAAEEEKTIGDFVSYQSGSRPTAP